MSLRRRFLSSASTSVLAAASVTFFIAADTNAARADCSLVSGAPNFLTECVGLDADGYFPASDFNTDTNGDGITDWFGGIVKVLDGAVIEGSILSYYQVVLDIGYYDPAGPLNLEVRLLGSGTVTHDVFNESAIDIRGPNAFIYLQDTALIEKIDKGAGALIIGENGGINLRNNSKIETDGTDADGAVIGGDAALISLQENAIIQTVGAEAEGAIITGNAGVISLKDDAKIQTNGGDAQGALIVGDAGIISLQQDAKIQTNGINSESAVISGDNGLILLMNQSAVTTLQGNSAAAFIDGNAGRINLGDSTTVFTLGENSTGASISGNNGTINLLDDAVVQTLGDDSDGMQITGNNGIIFLAGNAEMTTAGEDASGVDIIGVDASIALHDNAQIKTTGLHGHGVFVDGDDGIVTLSDSSSISTTDDGAQGIKIVGDKGNITIGADANVETLGNASSAISFTDGDNSLTNAGLLSTANAIAILGADNGADTIDNSGTITGGNGVAIDLRGGDDQLTLDTGSVLNGLSDGGDGTDMLILEGTGSEDDVFQNFELMGVVGDWSLSGDSTVATQITVGGTLWVDGTLTSPLTEVAGVLGGSGTLVSDVDSIGTISPGDEGAIGTLTVDGDFTQTGGAFDIEFDDNSMDLLTVTGTATINGAPEINLTALNGATGVNGTFLHADGGITGTFGAVNYTGNGAATLVQTANDAGFDVVDDPMDPMDPVDPTTLGIISVDGTPVVAGNFAALQAGLDYLDMVTETQLDQLTQCLDDSCAVTGGKRLWARGFGHFGHEAAQDGNQAYDYRTAGAAIGGELEVATGLSLGGSLGYGDVTAKLTDRAARTESDAEFLALYATYEAGPFFITGIASGGLQQFDLSRKVATAGGHDTARAETDAWQAGGSLQTGLKVDLGDGWRLTPTAGVAYQHLDVDGYHEHGAGLGNVAIGDQESDALRLNAQLKLAKTVALSQLSLVPHAYLGVAEQINVGDGVDGSFTTGDDFTLSQRNDDRVIGLAGAGVDFTFTNGVSTNIDYRTQLSGDHQDHAIVAGVAIEW